MNIDHQQDPKVDTITISQRPRVLTMAFAVLPVLIAIQVCYVATARNLPLPLLMLLGTVMASSIALAGLSIEAMMPVRLVLNRQGLQVKRAFSADHYGWGEITELKLVAANGSLTDDATRDGIKQVGIGVFLRNPTRPARNAKPTDLPGDAPREADAILASTAADNVLQVQSLLKVLADYKRRAIDGSVSAPRRIDSGATVRVGAEFRRRQQPS